MALLAIGLHAAFASAATFVMWLYRSFVRPGRDLGRRYGAWAVVTGATDGIGRGMALELARQGLHLVLIGRNPVKLSRVGDEVQKAAPSCKVRSVVFDLAGDAPKMSRGVARVAAAVEGLDVGILVNNAGATYPGAAYFHEVETPVWEAVVRVNVEAATRIAGVVVPAMAMKRRGAVVNVGSGSSVVLPAFPLYAVYAASKAATFESTLMEPLDGNFLISTAKEDRESRTIAPSFKCRWFYVVLCCCSVLCYMNRNCGRYIDQFSRSLSIEYKQYEVDLQCQIPLYVATKMSRVGNSLFIPSPEEYAKAAVRCIGYEAGCVPYWRHSIQCFFASLLPDLALNAWRLRVGIRKRREMKAPLGEDGS
ncbi:very-long-chain 3-oxoacyl-CoA reductase-like protein At1g24470 [Triticum aestivum]|uniref:Inactive hydroxysteroid dehydrogenase-like protein 1 n=1 Tax=Aegilops tauschii TaxID=37682 RepID=M8BGL6_AEGTA|nr:very-long-chain 3-oxoacyl-CoA reductase-like protein At1g24470 [Triticum aestivum]